jgi:ribosomal protein RSM22 (predicted rRNA methylase)
VLDPGAFREALRVLVDAYPPRDVASATERLIASYRDPERLSAPNLAQPIEVAAYAAYRAPATHASVSACFDAISAARPDFAPRTLLDAGAGPGTAAWVALEHFASVTKVECIERNSEMIALGERLSASLGAADLVSWRGSDLVLGLDGRNADLVIASYALGELSEDRTAAAVNEFWRSTEDLLLIVEPGTPAGFAVVRRARAQLIELGGLLVAPCPAEMPCPMAGDWCHFATRLQRGRAHRSAKGATLSYEDEKFSYVAASKRAASVRAARVLRHPQVRTGMIRLQLCTPEGAQERVVTRREGDVFRRARKTAWGDVWSEDGVGEISPE